MPKQNNIKKTCFAIFLACSLTSTFAQDEPEKTEPEKLAVYVSGAGDAGINKSFSNKLLAVIVQSGKYAEIGNSEAFYEELAKSYNGDIGQIAQTAKQHGANFVCVVSMTEAFDTYSISARIINTIDSQVIKTGSLDRSIKSFDDLVKVSNELASQLFQLPTQELVPTPVAATQTAKKECKSIFNINELLFKIQSGLLDQLKDCSATLAKNIALSKSPFGKKTELKEPKAFMMECTIDGIKQKLPSGVDEYIKPVKSLVQNTLSAASAANGELDVAKLSKAIGDMNIGELLDEIRKLAGEDDCMVDELYEPPVALEGKEEGKDKEDKRKVVQWGLRGGLNYSELGFNFGLVSDIAVSSWFHIQPGVMYIQKGTGNHELPLTLHYIDVPLLLSFKIFAVRLNIGPYIGICVNGGNGGSYDSYENIYKSFVVFGFDVGFGFDIGKFYIGIFGTNSGYPYGHNSYYDNGYKKSFHSQANGLNFGVNL